MRVLHFYKTSILDSTGGVETFIDNLCNATADLGVENTVLALAAKVKRLPVEHSAKYQTIQVKRHLFFASTGFSISAFKQFKRLAQQADIVHYYFPNPFADILHFCCRIKNPTVLTYQSDIIKQKYLLNFYRPLMHRFLRSMDRVVATSPNYLATSSTLAQLKSETKREKIKVIPIGIDRADYPEVTEERLDYWRTQLKQPFFLFVGALRYYKGLHFALDAVKDTNIQLVIAGGAVAGGDNVERQLKHYARQDQLNNVHFVDWISDKDKAALLQLCYGFIFPSHLRSEAFGISLLEAAAYAKPLISCEIGTGTSFVNQHQYTGLVVKPASPPALREAMQYLLANPDKARHFGQCAQQHYNKHFTLAKQAKAYVEVYKGLLRQ